MSRTLAKVCLPFDEAPPSVHFPKALKRLRNTAGLASNNNNNCQILTEVVQIFPERSLTNGSKNGTTVFPKPFGLKIAMPNISQCQKSLGKTYLTHFLKLFPPSLEGQ